MSARKWCSHSGCEAQARKNGLCQRHRIKDQTKAEASTWDPYDPGPPRQDKGPSPNASVYELAGASIGRLVSEKQEAYGDSFRKAGEVVRQLYPNGIRPEQYDSVLTVVRVIDKLFRIATAPGAFGENPWKDIGGYSLLEVVKGDNEKSSASGQHAYSVKSHTKMLGELWKATEKPVRSYTGDAGEDGWNG